MRHCELQLLSINAAAARPLQVGNKQLNTGLFKQPVSGPVTITAAGVPGDQIINRKFHGGPDQALYLYSREDSDWWAGQLQRELEPGFFGENLSISRWWADLRVGDRLQIGQVLLEITAPRMPCAVMASRVGNPAFLKAFIRAERSGAYARVLEPGQLCAGDAIEVVPAPGDYPRVQDIFRYWHAKGHNADFLRQVLRAPIAMILREALEQQLEQADATTGQLPGL